MPDDVSDDIDDDNDHDHMVMIMIMMMHRMVEEQGEAQVSGMPAGLLLQEI